MKITRTPGKKPQGKKTKNKKPPSYNLPTLNSPIPFFFFLFPPPFLPTPFPFSFLPSNLCVWCSLHHNDGHVLFKRKSESQNLPLTVTDGTTWPFDIYDIYMTVVGEASKIMSLLFFLPPRTEKVWYISSNIHRYCRDTRRKKKKDKEKNQSPDFVQARLEHLCLVLDTDLLDLLLDKHLPRLALPSLTGSTGSL